MKLNVNPIQPLLISLVPHLKIQQQPQQNVPESPSNLNNCGCCHCSFPCLFDILSEIRIEISSFLVESFNT